MVAVLMAIWWITEAILISATALVPNVLLPILGVESVGKATDPYANPLIFLFLGEFLIAEAMQEWDLHRRIALNVVHFMGTRTSSLIIGFMLASAFLSMWVSNTATTAAFIPILVFAAIGMNQNPLLILVPATISASCAFMLSVATPQNAIVYGSGKISVTEMSWAGLWLKYTLYSFNNIVGLYAYQLGVPDSDRTTAGYGPAMFR